MRRMAVVCAVVIAVTTALGATLPGCSRPSGDNEATVRLSDDFDSPGLESLAGRPLTESPAPASGQAVSRVWTVPLGSFVTARHHVVGGPTSSNDTPSVAVVKAPGALRQVSARFDPAGDGMGLVFRYRDARNFWMLVPASGFGTWNLYATVNHKATFMGNTGLSGLGTGTVTVELSGADIEISVVRGRGGQHLSSSLLADARGAGLIAFVDASDPARGAAFTVTSLK